MRRLYTHMITGFGLFTWLGVWLPLYHCMCTKEWCCLVSLINWFSRTFKCLCVNKNLFKNYARDILNFCAGKKYE